ncbi:hypothetical protein AR457_38940 [Streptomyces agglomeratus]|nr:hypothetical protein AR457_38940 [Streptomyces agglomeratus]OEJ49581.1 hypothetical protein BGK72_00920 [Streptomyces agglomeratus]OEJ56800.1 hypothetical protein BGM19_00800 [Streptomyces agglomeratus]
MAARMPTGVHQPGRWVGQGPFDGPAAGSTMNPEESLGTADLVDREVAILHTQVTSLPAKAEPAAMLISACTRQSRERTSFAAVMEAGECEA